MNIEIDAGSKPAVEREKSGLLASITLEHVFYGVILFLGTAIRFYQLGAIPLSPDESTHALSVWKSWQAGAESVRHLSPAYFALTSPLVQVLGYSDPAMRLVPALFGSALILTPWWLRAFTGRLGALIASLLIAVSPLLVISSRTAGGTSIALFAGMLLAIGWLNYQRTRSSTWFYLAASAFGLGLTSSPLFYTFLLTFLLALFGERILGPAMFKNALGIRRAVQRPEGEVLRMGALLFAAAFLLSGTGFLLNMSGIGDTIQIAAQWLGAFLTPASLLEWLRPVTLFIRFELLSVILGGAAVLWATWRGRAYPTFLVYWFMGGLMLLFIQRGEVSNSLVLSLVGILLVAVFVDRLISVKTGLSKWILAAITVFAGIVIYVNLGRYSRLLYSELAVDVRTRSYHLLLAAVVAAVVILIMAILWNSSRRGAVQGFVVGLLILLVCSSWSTAIWLATEAANDTRELWAISATDDDIRQLALTVKQSSWQAVGSDVDLNIVSTIDHPAVAWYLRDMRNLSLGGSLSAVDTPSAVLTGIDQDARMVDEYTGIDFAYARPPANYPLDSSTLLPWWLFHENSNTVVVDRLVFWLRSDLVGID